MKRRAIIPKPELPTLVDDFLAEAEADALLRWCETDVPWQREVLSLFGKRHAVPRQTAWFAERGVNYRYSGHDHPGCGWPVQVKWLAERLGANHLLLNRYQDGREYMGWHRDDERGVDGPVSVVSLGAQRRLRYRLGTQETVSYPIDMPHGSLLLLDGRLPHTLPKALRVSQPRVSLSFRKLCV